MLHKKQDICNAAYEMMLVTSLLQCMSHTLREFIYTENAHNWNHHKQQLLRRYYKGVSNDSSWNGLYNLNYNMDVGSIIALV